MFNINNIDVHNLADVLTTSDYDKKLAMYSAIVVYLLNHDSVFLSNPLLTGDRFNAIYRAKAIEFCYGLNEISVMDKELFLTILDKYVAVKRDILKVEFLVTDHSDGLSGIFGIKDIFGEMLEKVDKNFDSFKRVYNLLFKIRPIQGV